MKLRVTTFAMACASLAAASVLALLPADAVRAQAPAPAAPQSKDWVEPPAVVPRPPRGDRAKNLDLLFQALKIAPDDDTAKAIEERIWALWTTSGSDTANLMMSRVKSAVEKEDLDLAIKLLDALVDIKPDYVEAWNRRATIYFMKKDYGHSIADIREVLQREPRHFGALAGLGMILQDIGDDAHALDAFRRALAVNPRLKGIPERVKTLTEKVEGRDI